MRIQCLQDKKVLKIVGLPLARGVDPRIYNGHFIRARKDKPPAYT